MSDTTTGKVKSKEEILDFNYNSFIGTRSSCDNWEPLDKISYDVKELIYLCMDEYADRFKPSTNNGYIDALKQIAQFSDAGNVYASISRMKEIASNAVAGCPTAAVSGEGIEKMAEAYVKEYGHDTDAAYNAGAYCGFIAGASSLPLGGDAVEFGNFLNINFRIMNTLAEDGSVLWKYIEPSTQRPAGKYTTSQAYQLFKSQQVK